MKNVANDIKKAATISEYKAGRPYQKWSSVGPKQGSLATDQSPCKALHTIGGLKSRKVDLIKALGRDDGIDAGK